MGTQSERGMYMDFQFRALTDIWTGGVEGKPNKLHVTGIKGSIRWWYETIMRGLDKYACDPRNLDKSNTCLFEKAHAVSGLSLCEQTKATLCPACYMFGCTGWSGKFNVAVRLLDGNKYGPLITNQIRANDSFVICLIERKVLEPAERTLLRMTMQLIAEYGAIGAKTVFKPSEIRAKNTKLHHRDFGIITTSPIINLPVERNLLVQVNEYLKDFPRTSDQNDRVWPDLRNFWFMKGAHINRAQHNSIVGRDENGRYTPNPSDKQAFLGGFIGREKGVFQGPVRSEYANTNAASKKVFSFRGSKAGDAVERCFGYTRRGELDDFVKLLKTVMPAISQQDVVMGDRLLEIKD
ncbi:MAG: hypothetical protein A4E62_00830 [Syntrophorhabdus sp. PtaU1.Bin002]|nr:MAG: hypothetical protein A4E62_00830 [Syntrophorhabdus sp. PtaU1.Bin002]